jgi:hypothetical protein
MLKLLDLHIEYLLGRVMKSWHNQTADFKYLPVLIFWKADSSAMTFCIKRKAPSKWKL